MDKNITLQKGLLCASVCIPLTFCLTGCTESSKALPSQAISIKAESSSSEVPTIVVKDKSPAMVPIEKASTSSSSSYAEQEATENANSFHGYILSAEEQNNPRVKCIETAQEDRVVLTFAGDINFDENYSNMNTYRSIGQGIYGVLSDNLMSEMNSADIFMINNEFPYSDRGTPTPNKTFTFRVKPSHVENLQNMGVDIVSLANNHAYDYGPDALIDTFETLKNADIPYVGAGHNIEEAMQPYYFIAGGMKIAYVSATQIERNDPPDTKEATEDSPGVLRTLDPTKLVSVIGKAEENADFTVVYVHWGSENTYDVEQSQRDLANAYINAGADLIIGDHSHCLQGFEYINNVPIIYSMGNFWFSSKDLDTGLVKATITKSGIDSLQFIPCVQHNCKTDMYEKGSSEYDRILGVMAGLSYDVSITTDGFVKNGAGNGVSETPPKPLKKASYQLTPEEQAALALEAIQSATEANE